MRIREIIDHFESEGELIRITEFTDPVKGIAAITRKMSSQEGERKALLFENTGTLFPVLTNLFGSRKRISYILGCENINSIDNTIDAFIKEFTNGDSSLIDKIKFIPLFSDNSHKWLPKETKGTPKCQDIVMFKPELSRLPILQNGEKDSGRFITTALIHTYDPVTDIRNIELCRAKFLSDETLGINLKIHSTAERNLIESGEEIIPIALTIGGDPIYTCCASLKTPEFLDKYSIAGFMRDRSVEMAECLSQDIEIPADSDIVIEGYIDMKEEIISEGVVGDSSGFYSCEDKCRIMHITTITHRKDAIYLAAIYGFPPQENIYFNELAAKVYAKTLNFSGMREIEEIYLPPESAEYNIAVVKIKKIYPWQAMKVAHALWGCREMMHNKFLLIIDNRALASINDSENRVDEDESAMPDIRNLKVLSKAVMQYYSPKSNTLFSRGFLDSSDQSSPYKGFGGKMCIDATYKLDEESPDCRTSGLHEIRNNDNTAFIEFIHKGEQIPSGCKIVVYVDNNIDTSDTSLCLSIAGLYSDAIKDSSFQEVNGDHILIIDASGHAVTPLL